MGAHVSAWACGGHVVARDRHRLSGLLTPTRTEDLRAGWTAAAVRMDAGDTTLVLTNSGPLPGYCLVFLDGIWLHGLELTVCPRMALSSPSTCLSLTHAGSKVLTATQDSVYFCLLLLLIRWVIYFPIGFLQQETTDTPSPQTVLPQTWEKSRLFLFFFLFRGTGCHTVQTGLEFPK